MTTCKLAAALALAVLTMAAAAASARTAAAATQAEQTAATPASLVPADFNVPVMVKAAGFTLVPLGSDLVTRDFDAYMASIEHLQTSFTRSKDWPHAGITAADAMTDMVSEQARFAARTSFAYAVLTPDGSRERGCVYVYPSSIPGYGAEVRLWVTKAEYDAGFDAELYT